MIVYGSSLSPFVRKVLVICAEKGIEVDHRVSRPGQPDPEFLAISPFKKIPAIRDGDYTLTDSTAIALYLEAKYPTPALIPQEAEVRGRVIWFDELADTIGFAALRPVFFNRVVAKLMGMAADEAAAAKAEAEELPALVDYLEGVIGGGWLLADQFTLADVAVGSVFVNYHHAGGRIDDGSHPNLAAYLKRVHARPSFKTIIERDSAFLERAFAG